jgi:hypothetical protein
MIIIIQLYPGSRKTGVCSSYTCLFLSFYNMNYILLSPAVVIVTVVTDTVILIIIIIFHSIKAWGYLYEAFE